MGRNYRVEQGDCLYKIAEREGFSHWRTIYDHASNAGFRELRPDPDVIYPGDTLYIPDLQPKDEYGETEKLHRFRKETEETYLHLVIEDEEGKRIEGNYTIDVEGKTVTDELIDGEIEMEIPADAEVGSLVIRSKNAPTGVEWTWPLSLGHLDPLDNVSGVQGRLWNLGYDCGPVDNIEGKLTRAGVKNFQMMAFDDPDEWDGIAGSKTKQKFLDHHKI